MTVVFTGHSATILPAAVSALCDSREVAIVASKGIGKEGRNNILVDPRTLSHTEMNVCSGFKKGALVEKQLRPLRFPDKIYVIGQVADAWAPDF